jgi:hypothetical protein
MTNCQERMMFSVYVPVEMQMHIHYSKNISIGQSNLHPQDETWTDPRQNQRYGSMSLNNPNASQCFDCLTYHV